MNNVLQIVENEETSEFYPTPESLVNEMLSSIDFDKVKTILEPSAGKGDILREIALREYSGNYHSHYFDVDCIEIDPNLRQILKYNFSDTRKEEIREEIKQITSKYKYCEHRYGEGWSFYNEKTRQYEKLPLDDRTRLAAYEREKQHFFSEGIHIVHDDFLSYEPLKQYDLIIMNPPFSNGALHLMKALEIQKKGGNIVCLLNAETIRNPYTAIRKELAQKLKQYNAEIKFIQNAFVSAERKTGVEVALIKVAIENMQEESEIYERLKEAERIDEIDIETKDLEVSDYIKAAVARFKVESKAGIELIRQYRALIPYMATSFGDDDWDKKPILRLTDNNDRGYESVSINDYLKKVRYKYWKALLGNEKFIGKLTSKLQTDYREKVDNLSNYDFTEYNIRTLSAEMNSHIKTGIENEIMVMFDHLTEEHAYYPECSCNRHYYDGWATNKAHKIDKKVIIPCYGVFDTWDGKPRTYNARGTIEDIERILNYLDGGMTIEVDLWNTLERYFNAGITKKIPLKFFKATFYKKGTIHLEFTCPELIERFNIYAAQNKSWLPPCYGKKKYKDMTTAEKNVIDSFQGEKAYNDILANSNYYLAPVANNNPLLLEQNS